jgi:hypothetical protein
MYSSTPSIYCYSIQKTNNICWVSLQKVLVVGDVVHWLCLTDVGSYVLMLHVTATRVSEMALPASFPRREAPGSRENFIGDKISINPIIPFIAEVR